MIIVDQVTAIQPSKDVTFMIDDRAPPQTVQVIRAKCTRDDMVVSTEYDQRSTITKISIRVGKFKLTDASESAIIDKLKVSPVAGFRINNCFLPSTPLSVSIDVFTYEVGRYTRVPIWLLKKDSALVVQFTQPRTDIYPDEWPHPPRRSKLDRQSRRQP